jgi:hypothetical protein
VWQEEVVEAASEEGEVVMANKGPAQEEGGEERKWETETDN